MILSLFSLYLLSERSKSDADKKPAPGGSDDTSSKKKARRLEFSEKSKPEAEHGDPSEAEDEEPISGSSGRYLITFNFQLTLRLDMIYISKFFVTLLLSIFENDFTPFLITLISFSDGGSEPESEEFPLTDTPLRMTAPKPVALYAHQPFDTTTLPGLDQLAVPLASGLPVQNPFLDQNPPTTLLEAGLTVTTPTKRVTGPHGTPPAPSAFHVTDMSPPMVAPSSARCK